MESTLTKNNANSNQNPDNSIGGKPYTLTF